MPNTFEALGCEYGTLESRPVDEDVEPLETLLSKGLGACFGPSNPFVNEVFFFGGFVMRLALLTERLVSLIPLALHLEGRKPENSLQNICNGSIFTFSLSFYTWTRVNIRSRITRLREAHMQGNEVALYRTVSCISKIPRDYLYFVWIY
jgi:hypothetical protein